MAASRTDPILKRLEKICRSLPGAVLEFPWGSPHFKVGGKIFCGCGEDRGRLGIGFKATLPEQALLIQDPRFSVAAYVGRHGWTSISAEGRLDWKEIEHLVRRSYELVAPKNLTRVPGTVLKLRRTAGRSHPR